MLLTTLSQIIVSLSILTVWIFRFHIVEKEFKDFGLSNIVRNLVGVTKTSLSSILLLGIWYQELVFYPTFFLSIFMLSAQYFHYSVNNRIEKHLPSLCLLFLCVIIMCSKI